MGLFFALVNISHLLRQVCPPDTETEGSRTVIKTLLEGKEDCIARGYPFGAEVLSHVIGGWQSKTTGKNSSSRHSEVAELTLFQIFRAVFMQAGARLIALRRAFGKKVGRQPRNFTLKFIQGNNGHDNPLLW